MWHGSQRGSGTRVIRVTKEGWSSDVPWAAHTLPALVVAKISLCYSVYIFLFSNYANLIKTQIFFQSEVNS